jgi:DNA repair protein RadA/Sms
MKLKEPAVDLAIIAALYSSLRDKPISRGVMVLGEVGLTGELRRVPSAQRAIKEAEKLGFKRFIVPWGSFTGVKKLPEGVKQVKTVNEALNLLFS